MSKKGLFNYFLDFGLPVCVARLILVVFARLIVSTCLISVVSARLIVSTCQISVVSARLILVVFARLIVSTCQISVVSARLIVSTCQISVVSALVSRPDSISRYINWYKNLQSFRRLPKKGLFNYFLDFGLPVCVALVSALVSRSASFSTRYINWYKNLQLFRQLPQRY